MKINGKQIPLKTIKEIKMLLYIGKITIEEIIQLMNKKNPKLKIDYYDVTDIEQIEIVSKQRGER